LPGGGQESFRKRDCCYSVVLLSARTRDGTLVPLLCSECQHLRGGHLHVAYIAKAKFQAADISSSVNIRIYRHEPPHVQPIVWLRHTRATVFIARRYQIYYGIGSLGPELVSLLPLYLGHDLAEGYDLSAPSMLPSKRVRTR
jgi:hypothetical protein